MVQDVVSLKRQEKMVWLSQSFNSATGSWEEQRIGYIKTKKPFKGFGGVWELA